jgi:hypothetical protein
VFGFTNTPALAICQCSRLVFSPRIDSRDSYNEKSWAKVPRVFASGAEVRGTKTAGGSTAGQALEMARYYGHFQRLCGSRHELANPLFCLKT